MCSAAAFTLDRLLLANSLFLPVVDELSPYLRMVSCFVEIYGFACWA